MEDFSQLDHLYTELDTAVGQLISDYSVMEGYSNTADEVKEKLDQNSREVEELRDLYRFVTITTCRCTCTMLVLVCFTASQFVRNYWCLLLRRGENPSVPEQESTIYSTHIMSSP